MAVGRKNSIHIPRTALLEAELDQAALPLNTFSLFCVRVERKNPIRGAFFNRMSRNPSVATTIPQSPPHPVRCRRLFKPMRADQLVFQSLILCVF